MKSVFLVGLLYLIWFFGYSQGSTDDLDQIRERVREIDAHRDQYEQSYFNDTNLCNDSMNDNHSLEGAELYEIMEVDLVKYFNDGALAKIEVFFEGTHENLQSEYYFKDDQLVFVRKIKTIFHKSRYHQDFDASKYSAYKNSFYFDGKNLLRWVNTKIEVEEKWEPEYPEHASTILHDVELYRNYRTPNSQ